MAAVPIAITNAVIVDKWNRVIHTGISVYGDAVRSDVGVGGGPIQPPEGGGGGDKPDHIWGPNDPRPTPPIHIPPTTLPDLPDHIWGPNDPRPTPPIYLPTPTPPEGSLITWKAVWTEQTGWVVIGVPNVPHPAPS